MIGEYEMFWNFVIIVIIFLVGFLINHIAEYKKLKLDNEILELQVKEIRNHFEIYKNVSNCENGETENLRKQNAELLMENMQLKSIVSAYRNTFGNGFHNTYSKSQIPQGTIEAVKYAMKYSHPDAYEKPLNNEEKGRWVYFPSPYDKNRRA